MAPDDIDPDFRKGLKQDVQHAHRAVNQGGSSNNGGGSGCELVIVGVFLVGAVLFVASQLAKIGVLL